MESISDSGTFSNPKESRLNLSGDSDKNEHLSTETAKYNMSRKEQEHKQETKLSNSSQILLGNSSSEDNSSDSDDMTGFSLAALAVKNRLSKSNIKYKIAATSAVLNSPIPNKMEESNSDSSVSEGFSLHKLGSKYKPSQMSASSLNAVDKPFITITKENKYCNVCQIPRHALGSGEINYVNKSSDTIKTTFLAASFSDDSDSDEFMTLAGLVSSHKRSTTEGETGSADELRTLQPKALTRVTSTQRYHTKSESDSLSPASQSVLKNALDNETSTSLGSLKGGMEAGKDFKFSLGCDIPNSFKSNYSGSSLASSWRSLGTVSPQNSHSDIDVSFMSIDRKPSTKMIDIPLTDENNSNEITDIEFGGIDLLCAIKVPSNSKSRFGDISEMETDSPKQHEEMEIITLLDQLDVEDEKDVLENKIEMECTYDATYILNVKMKLKTTKCSSFGKVICRKWKPLHAPYFKKKVVQSTVVPFTFTTLSPDDEVESNLKRRH